MAVAKAKDDGRKTRAAAGGGSATWLLGVACGVVVTFATPSAVLAAVLLAPAILAAVFDGQAGRPVTRVVFVSGAGMTFLPLWHLNAASATLGSALDMLADPTVLCPAWLAAASGWALCEALPILLQGTANRRAAWQISVLEQEAATLRAEWDLDAVD